MFSCHVDSDLDLLFALGPNFVLRLPVTFELISLKPSD